MEGVGDKDSSNDLDRAGEDDPPSKQRSDSKDDCQHSTCVKNVPPPGEVSVLNATSKSMQTVFTEPSPPVQITVDQVSSESLSLRWDPPAGEVESYIVTCCHEGDIVQESTDTNKLNLSNLKPGVCYTLEVSTQFRDRRISEPAVTSARTKPSPAVQITVDQVSSESLSLRWDPPAGEVESYIVTCCHEGDIVQESTDTNKLTLSNLKPGVCYTLIVSTQFRDGRISEPAVTSARTKPSPPVQITVDQVSSESLSLRWDPPAGEVESYIVTCCHEGDIVQESTDANKLTLSNLKPGVCYTLEVSTQFRDRRISESAVTSARTNRPE
ncbi:collagen alpha-1(XII) chain-like [Lycodopsis pacificus]